MEYVYPIVQYVFPLTFPVKISMSSVFFFFSKISKLFQTSCFLFPINYFCRAVLVFGCGEILFEFLFTPLCFFFLSCPEVFPCDILLSVCCLFVLLSFFVPLLFSSCLSLPLMLRSFILSFSSSFPLLSSVPLTSAYSLFLLLFLFYHHLFHIPPQPIFLYSLILWFYPSSVPLFLHEY